MRRRVHFLVSWLRLTLGWLYYGLKALRKPHPILPVGDLPYRDASPLLRTAAHEAGHALNIYLSPYCHLISVSINEGAKHSGVVRMRTDLSSPVAYWDRIVTTIGGLTGEVIFAGSFNAQACRSDLQEVLKIATIIADACPDIKGPDKVYFDMGRCYRKRPRQAVVNILNLGYNVARAQILNHVAGYHTLTWELMKTGEMDIRTVAHIIESATVSATKRSASLSALA